MKLLKQFHSARIAHTPLKRGVNERLRAERDELLDAAHTPLKRGVYERAASIRVTARRGHVGNGPLENEPLPMPFISLTPGFSQVQKTATDGNRFNGFPD